MTNYITTNITKNTRYKENPLQWKLKGYEVSYFNICC